MNDLTPIFQALDAADPVATERLLPLVYDAPRRLAAAQLANEKQVQTLQPMALEYEAYLRLDGGLARESGKAWATSSRPYRLLSSASWWTMRDARRPTNAAASSGGSSWTP